MEKIRCAVGTFVGRRELRLRHFNLSITDPKLFPPDDQLKSLSVSNLHDLNEPHIRVNKILSIVCTFLGILHTFFF